MKKIKKFYTKMFFVWLLATSFGGAVMSFITDDWFRTVAFALLVGLFCVTTAIWDSDFIMDNYKHLYGEDIIFNAKQEKQRVFYQNLHAALIFGSVFSVIIIALSVWLNFLLWILPFILLLCIYMVTIDSKHQFASNAEKTTCPKCKIPFSFKVESSYGKKLNREYKTKDVKEGYGKDAYTRRGVFAYGKQEVYYSEKCHKCGMTHEWKDTTRYEEEV